MALFNKGQFFERSFLDGFEFSSVFPFLPNNVASIPEIRERLLHKEMKILQSNLWDYTFVLFCQSVSVD